MRQSKRQAQVCEPVVISSNEDMGEVCNLEKDMKMLIFRYLSLEYSLCSLLFYHHHAFSPSTDLSSPCIFSFYRSRPICLIVVFLLLPLPWRYATDSGLNCFVLIHDHENAEALVQLSGGWANASLSSISPAKTP